VLKATKMQLECSLCLAYLAFTEYKWKEAKELFDNAYFVANEIGEKKIAEQCLCNSGIAASKTQMSDKDLMQ
jgi:hypothetical protein